MRLSSLFFLICFFLVLPVKAAEIDTFTLHDMDLPDSTEQISDIINSRLQEGIDRANDRQDDFTLFSERQSCDEEILYTELRKAIFQAVSVSIGLKGYSLDKQLRELLVGSSQHLTLADSVYRDITFIEGISLNLKELSDVVRVGDQLIGLDKIGHFFAEGWGYFQRTREDKLSSHEAISWGRSLEEGLYGFMTTGVFSHADLVANFHGYRFWLGLRKTGQDPLKSTLADFFTLARISCNFELFESIKERKVIRRWVLKKPFDIADYVDGTWNEANNCNSYKNEEIFHKVSGRIVDVWPGFHCPADKSVCERGRKRYGRYAKELLHPDCLGVARVQD